MSSISPATSLRFGPFELDLHAAELRRSGTVIKLQEQTFRLLVKLLERPNDVITRDELRAALWPAGTYVDFEHGLGSAIGRLREVLGDSAAHPAFIETIARHGYRFIAPVATTIANPGDVERTGPARRRSLRNRVVVVGSVVCVLLIAVAAVLWRHTPAKPAGRIMLAVLPFDDLGAAPSQDRLADGITEDLITQLGHYDPQRLGVIARTSAQQYRKTRKSVAQVGRELGVSYVVEGSVRRDGTQVRITAQLIQVRDQTHLWAKAYDRDVNAALDLEREVAADVAREIEIRVAPKPPPSP